MQIEINKLKKENEDMKMECFSGCQTRVSIDI